MDLSQRQMRVLKMSLLRAPSVGHLVQDDLDDLNSRAADPSYALGVEFDLRGEVVTVRSLL